MKNNKKSFHGAKTGFFEAVFTPQAQLWLTPFFFRPHEPNILACLAHVWLTPEPNILKLNYMVWLMSGSLKTKPNEMYGSWLIIYIYMSQ